MKNIIQLFLIIVLAAGLSYGQSDELTILYLGDTHSYLAPFGPRNEDLSGTQGGIARAVSVIGSYESLSNVITLHAGDFSIGDLFYNKFFGVPELQILDEAGVDAMTVGNHEFDLTPDALLGALSAAFAAPGSGFPLLSANADLTAYPAIDPFIDPYKIMTVNGIKVGIFGLTTHSTMLLSNPSPIVISDQFIPKAAEMTAILTAAGCDFIICLSHYGFLGDQAIAAYVPGINLIIGGHDHSLISPVKINDTWIVQAEAHYSRIGKITFDLSGTTVVMTGNEFIELNENVPEEPAVKAVVDNLISQIEADYGNVYTEQIGKSASFLDDFVEDVKKPGNHSSPVGNFITDAMRWKTGTDIAIEPGGSIAQPIYQGPLVAADLFRTVGYGFNTDNGLGFRVVTLDITGMELYKAMETILTFLDDDEFFPQVSGLTMKYIANAPEGQRVASILINKEPLNPFETYSLTTNEMVPMVLDAFQIVYSNLQIMTGYSEFQLLVDYMGYIDYKITPVRDARMISINNSGNVKKETEDQITALPGEFFLEQNYPNPFNPSTNIKFNLPYDSHVRLCIYNIMGEELEVLFDEFKTAGTYSITWNAGQTPAGVYIYSLQGEGITLTRKMIILK